MAHFAQIKNGAVTQVIVISNETVGEPSFQFPETENVGVNFILQVLGFAGEWRQTSYNGTFRKNYAGIGFSYDEIRDAFIPPKPYDSWILNEDTCLWEAPIPYPKDGKPYVLNEETQSWDPFEPEEEA
jgi:hypothetical protein